MSVSDSSGTKSHVFVMAEGEVIKRDVELGISNDQLQEIKAGLTVGDQVITGPARTLRKLEVGDSVEEIETKDQ